MEAVFPALPEFDGRRDDSVASPEFWKWDLAALKFLLHFRELHFEEFARLYDDALRRCPGAELAPFGSRSEVAHTVAHAGFFGATGDDDLPLQFKPGEEERYFFILRNLNGFGTFVVGVKVEAGLVKVLEEDGSYSRLTVSS